MKLGYVLACRRLMAEAARWGLAWEICYGPVDSEWDKSDAFLLVKEGIVPCKPPQVIGRTEAQAMDCISLTARLAKV